MTRRHDALIPLTHDHHHALHQLRILHAASGSGEAERVEAARAFVTFFREHSVLHFREEEEEIFPLVVGIPEAPLAIGLKEGIARILMEHVELHALVKELDRQAADGTVESAVMARLADLLKAHIRFEEDDLFPRIEAVVADRLGSVTLAERRRS